MNKRQWKKKYKKEHGCNPPSSKQIAKWTYVLSSAMKQYCDSICNMSSEIKRATDILSVEIKRICNDVFVEVKRVIDVIQNMPEDEFDEKILNLTPEQQKLAWKIRGKRKEQRNGKSEKNRRVR